MENMGASLVGALTHLGVPTDIAPADFIAWLKQRFPNWKFAGTFCQSVPTEWFRVQKGDYDLCFLGNSSIIVEATERMPVCGLMVIGALMSGKLLVLDTEDAEGVTVGSVDQVRALGRGVENPGRDYYHSFGMSYAAWLRHICRHPEDYRVL